MTTFLDKRIINLSSLYGDRKNGSKNSHVQFHFQGLLSNEKDIAYTEIGVVSAEIPVSFYTVNDNNNILEILFSPLVPNPQTYTITIPVGNYQSNTLIQELKSQIYTAVNFGGSGVEWLDIEISRQTGKLTFSCDFTLISQFQLIQSGSTCWYILGGGDTSIYNFVSPASPSHILDLPMTLLGTNKISINTDSLNTYNYDSALSGFSNTLSSIEVDAPPFGIILYKNSSITYNILRVNSINQFSIELLDDFRRYINFNGVEWTITLALNIHRYVPDLRNTTFSDILLEKGQPKEKTKEKEKDKDLELLQKHTK